MEETPRWEPDMAMVFSVRTHTVPISDLSGPDRSWLIAALTVQGWTVAAIAARLHCSLRLVQQIKAEPMTTCAFYALDLQRQLTEAKGIRHVEGLVAAGEIQRRDQVIERLRKHRDALLDHLMLKEKELRHAREVLPYLRGAPGSAGSAWSTPPPG